jgi:hypothetical protein
MNILLFHDRTEAATTAARVALLQNFSSRGQAMAPDRILLDAAAGTAKPLEPDFSGVPFGLRWDLVGHPAYFRLTPTYFTLFC